MDVLYEMSRIVGIIGLEPSELPDHSTVCARYQRLKMPIWRVLLRLSAELHDTGEIQAIDATGMERISASQHYAKRTNYTFRAVKRSCSDKLVSCERERFEPLIASCCSGVAEAVRERGCSSFYLMKDTFYAVPVTVSFVPELEAVTLTGILQRSITIDEKHDVDDAVFLSKLSNEVARNNLVLVGSSFVWSNSFESGSTAAYSQYCSSSSQITVSSTAT